MCVVDPASSHRARVCSAVLKKRHLLARDIVANPFHHRTGMPKKPNTGS
jgi:hypothetical protein